ncbi:hypothetical protein LIER_00946 [Lithospermum erythrorhizon]|uniref:Embryonic stem cell-specific 5-hydroxymethylcytosine-binding protein n=1 Tax=Lithospermum erythrorhizon TaxID=34254 RepID=A0AAV3NNZ8_LITER
MCGRCRCTLRPHDVSRGRTLRHINMDRYRPSYNVSPGFNVPVVRRDDGKDKGEEEGVVLHCMKWGLVPSFTKKTDKPDHYKMFNSRSETIREKASFRRLIPNSRCLVSVEGFYEWKKDGSKKQPYYIHFKDGKPLVFAALYDSWKNAEGEVLYTFTILTTSSSSSLQWLHDRMPVILGNKESSDMWLNGRPTSNFDTLLKPYEEADLMWYPVTPAMGKPSFDSPECINEIQLKCDESKSISHFFMKKGAKGEKEHNNEDKRGHMKNDESRSLKEEKEVDIYGTQSTSNTNELDIKPKVLPPWEEPVDSRLKQEVDDFPQFPAGMDQHPTKTDHTASSPERKKIKVANNVGTSGSTKELPEEKHELGAFVYTTKPTTPVKMKGKGANDSQQKLFAYFKKN